MIFVIVTALITFALTAVIRRFSLRRGHLDIPNERSSHSSPTPHGGGIAVVVATLVAGLLLLGADKLSAREFTAIFVPGLAIAVVGRLDDLGRLTSAKWRLAIHFMIAAFAVGYLGGLPALTIIDTSVDFSIIGNCVAVIYLVWLLNLFNFMDGIDLITSVETATVCLVSAWILQAKSNSGLWILVASIGAALIGFGIFNIPPAKIFLGDVGSAFIGVTIGVVTILVADGSPRVAWSIVILLAIYISDSTVTLLRRLVSREHVYKAHRTHAYQHLAKKFDSHLKVSVGVGAINLIWLAPIAWLVADSRVVPIVGLAIAYAPLILAAFLLQAGKPKLN